MKNTIDNIDQAIYQISAKRNNESDIESKDTFIVTEN
tara:strand:+ start:316 stop:426 length:111 start_codon:yes stop_codon:yes gene_type:complete